MASEAGDPLLLPETAKNRKHEPIRTSCVFFLGLAAADRRTLPIRGQHDYDGDDEEVALLPLILCDHSLIAGLTAATNRTESYSTEITHNYLQGLDQPLGV
jgi:hypothetical protein